MLTAGLAAEEELTMAPVAVATAVEVVLQEHLPVVAGVAESVWRLCRRGGLLATLRFGCLMKAPVK